MPSPKSKIEVLFREIQNGNKVAFDELFVLYHDKLLAFAKQYIKQQESAEEITSELFVKIWLKRAALTAVLNPEVYLFVSVKNACLNQIRANKKKQQVFVEASTTVSSIPIPLAYTMQMEDKELLSLLDAAVATLPAQRQLIFKLIKEQGLKSAAVAQILGLSKRTVENQLYKAVKALAEAISSYLGYHPQTRNAKIQTLSNWWLPFF